MSFELAEGFIDLTMKDGVSSGMTSVRKTLLGVQQTFIQLASAVATGFAVTKIISFANETAKAQGVARRFAAVFGEQTGAATNFVDSYAKAIKECDKDLMGLMASFQTTLSPLGLSGKAATELSIKLTKLTEDASIFYGVEKEGMASDIESAIYGRAMAIRHYGVQITEAKINQELLNMGIRGGNEAATDEEKVLARINVITKEMANVNGAAEKSTSGYTGKVREFKNALEDLRNSIGTIVIPALTSLMSQISPVVQGIADWAIKNQSAIVSLGGFAAGILTITYIIPNIILGITAMIKAYQSLAIAQSILLSLSGPTGWAVLAAGIALAAASVMTLKAYYDDIATATAAVAVKNEIAAASFTKVASDADLAAASLKHYQDAAAATMTPGLSQLGEEADTIGLDKFQKVELELRQNNAYEGAKGYLEFLKEVITKKERELELSKQAKEVEEKTRTPIELYNREVARLNELLEKKLITQETYNRAIQQAKGQLDTATKKDPVVDKKDESAKSRAKQVFDETRTALEKYTQRLAELKELYAGGYLDEDTYNRSVQDATSNYEEKKKKNNGNIAVPSKPESGGIGFSDVRGMWSSMARSLNQKKDYQREINDGIKTVGKEQKEATEQLRQINQKTRQGAGAVGP